MKATFLLLCLAAALDNTAQSVNGTVSKMDPLSFGVILDDPATKKVTVKNDITFLTDEKGILKADFYFPPGLKSADKRPAIIFLNAVGDQPGAGQRKVKSWGIYTSWPRLMAANGYIGISMESDGARIQESIKGLFKFISEQGQQFNIDKDKLGVYAASANVTQSVAYLMSEKADRAIKAAVLYYGNTPAGPYRKDLPVLFVISEGDAAPNRYNGLWNEVLKNNAPWTIKMGTGMPHAFDAYTDNDEARKIVKETISFWKNHLDPVPQPSWGYSKARDFLGSGQMNPSRAAELIKSMAEEFPNDAGILNFYATNLRHDQKHEEAMSVYKRVLEIEPANVEVLVNLAALKYIAGKKDEADSYVKTAINTGKMTRNSYTQLAYVLLVGNKNMEAAMYFEKAVTMAPQRGVDYYNLACAYAKDGIKDKAFSALDNAVKHGYNSKQHFETDPDLNLIRADDRYQKLLAHLQ
jgi:tetratricopeptide (TPR) repeat protein